MAEEKAAEIVVDLSEWVMADFKRWTSVQTAQGAEGFDLVNSMMASVIKSWPHDLDPSDPASYDKLKPIPWKEAVMAVERATAAAFRLPGEGRTEGNQVRPVGHRANGSKTPA